MSKPPSNPKKKDDKKPASRPPVGTRESRSIDPSLILAARTRSAANLAANTESNPSNPRANLRPEPARGPTVLTRARRFSGPEKRESLQPGSEQTFVDNLASNSEHQSTRYGSVSEEETFRSPSQERQGRPS